MPLNFPTTIGNTKIDITNGTIVDCVALEDIKKGTFVYSDNLLRISRQITDMSGYGGSKIDDNFIMTLYASSYSTPAFFIYDTGKNISFMVKMDDVNILYDYDDLGYVYWNSYIYILATRSSNEGVIQIAKYRLDLLTNTASLTKIDYKQMKVSSRKVSDASLDIVNDKLLIGFCSNGDVKAFFVSEGLEITSPYSSLNTSYVYFFNGHKLYKMSENQFAILADETGKGVMIALYEIGNKDSITLKYSYVISEHHYSGDTYSSVNTVLQLDTRFFIVPWINSIYHRVVFVLLEISNSTVIIHDTFTMEIQDEHNVPILMYPLSTDTFLWFCIESTSSVSGNGRYYYPKKYVFSIALGTDGNYHIYMSSKSDYDTRLDTSNIYQEYPYSPCYDITNSYLRSWWCTGSKMKYYIVDIRPHIKQTTSTNINPCVGLCLENINKDDIGKVSIIKGGYI